MMVPLAGPAGAMMPVLGGGLLVRPAAVGPAARPGDHPGRGTGYPHIPPHLSLRRHQPPGQDPLWLLPLHPAGHTIELSAALCRAEDQAVCQVLAHEVLHTCPGCANHGPRWKAWAQKMTRAWGYQIRRSDTPQDLGLTDQRPVRYLVVCTRCGRQIPRMKRSPLVSHPERYRCRCGGELRVLIPGEN